jgi:hypothetical protein
MLSVEGVNAVIIRLIRELNTSGVDPKSKSKFDVHSVKQFRIETKLQKLKFLEHYATYFAKLSVYIYACCLVNCLYPDFCSFRLGTSGMKDG